MSPPLSSTCEAKRRSSSGSSPRRVTARRFSSPTVFPRCVTPTASASSSTAGRSSSGRTKSSWRSAAATRRCSTCRRSASPRRRTKRGRTMTSSSERLPDLPPALSSMWRLCKLGYRHEPRLMLAAFALSQLAVLPDALLAWWLKLLGQGLLANQPGATRTAALGLGVSVTATWFLATVSTRLQRRFRDKVTIALEAHVARLQASLVTLTHHERPDVLDRLPLLPRQGLLLDHMYLSGFF